MNQAKPVSIEELKNAKQQILDAVNAARDQLNILSGGQLHITDIQFEIAAKRSFYNDQGRALSLSELKGTMLVDLRLTFEGPYDLKIVM